MSPQAMQVDIDVHNPARLAAKPIKTVSHLIIETAFALVIASMMLSMGAAFCIKFLRWALG